MKRLLLLRHAKARKKLSESDFSRSLDPSGLVEAVSVGRFLFKENLVPQLVVSSPSVRTIETYNKVFDLPPFNKPQLKLEERIYNACNEDLVEIIKGLPDGIDNIMILGHNPAITSVINEFKLSIQNSDGNCYIKAIDADITCKLVRLESNSFNWTTIFDDVCCLRKVYHPEST
jgi:phosphohistidine phosphatase